VKVDRTTLFGNPFSVKKYGHDRAVALHCAWLTGTSIGKELSKELLQRRRAVLEALPALRGKNLACWCPLPGHGEPDICDLFAPSSLAVSWGGRQARNVRYGTELPIRDVRCHGEYWGYSGLGADAEEATQRTRMRLKPVGVRPRV
jgi:Domain of unknown function (DUF4326)